MRSAEEGIEHKMAIDGARFDETLNATGCSICRHVRVSEERFIWQMLYELGSDQGIRGQLDRSLGLCPRHAHLLVAVVEERELVDGASVAHLYESIVRKYLRSCRGTDAASRRVARALDGPEAEGCPLCAHRDGVENRTVDLLLGGLRSERGVARYAASDGLCNRHLHACLQRAGNAKLRRWLLDDHIERLEKLAGRLDELLRKQRYDVDEEIAPAEASSWREGIWRFAGMSYDRPLVRRRLR